MALGDEVWHVQNPALGALIIWRFTTAYSEGANGTTGCPLPMTFLVLPMILHAATAARIRGTQTRSGLRAFAGKFSTAKATEADVLLGLHDRAHAMRDQSLEALRTAVRARLVSADAASARVFPLSSAPARGVASSVRRLLADAEKLGAWCAELTPFEVASTLKVRF
jgi:hypothetical protein